MAVAAAEKQLGVEEFTERIRAYVMRHRCTASAAVDALRDELDLTDDARRHFERVGMIFYANDDRHKFNLGQARGGSVEEESGRRSFRTYLRFQHKSPHGRLAWEGLLMVFEGADGKVKRALDFTPADVAHKEDRDGAHAVAYAKRRKVDREWAKLLERFSVSVTRDLPAAALRELDVALRRAHG